MKKPLVFIGILLCIVIALLLVRITLVNSISTTGIRLVDLQNQISAYKNQNELLKVQYLQEASLTHLSDEAEKLGYVQEKRQIDLAAPVPLALR